MTCVLVELNQNVPRIISDYEALIMVILINKTFALDVNWLLLYEYYMIIVVVYK